MKDEIKTKSSRANTTLQINDIEYKTLSYRRETVLRYSFRQK